MDPELELGGYCGYVLRPGTHPLHKAYHDTEYGFPSRDESVLFERLILEINQAGLSWETVLKKRGGFVRAYNGFEVDAVAAYGEADVARLLGDAGIIRNSLKVHAAIENARTIQRLREFHGGFAEWLDAHRGPASGPTKESAEHSGGSGGAELCGEDKAAWVKLFKRTFRFTGGEIVGEFLMSLGYLPGAHVQGCEVGERVKAGAEKT